MNDFKTIASTLCFARIGFTWIAFALVECLRNLKWLQDNELLLPS
jgi:hypothetical protein